MKRKDLQGHGSPPGRKSEPGSSPRAIPRGGFRSALVGDSPRSRLLRILVTVHRFNDMVTARAGSARLADAVRSLVPLACEAFDDGPVEAGGGARASTLSVEQRQCIQDLEKLSKSLAQGLPEKSHDLAHAMDSLLVQCALIESTIEEASRPAVPVVSSRGQLA